MRDGSASLTWSHFQFSLSWSDATECLTWAEENQAGLREMLAWRRMSNDDTTDPVNDHFNDPVSPDNSHTYVNPEDDNDPQLDGQTEGFSDPEPHVADVDPHQRPPSTVVDTPRDSGDTQQDTPAVSAPAPRHVNADDVMEVLGKAVDAWSEVGQDSSDRAALAASLRRMADKIEGAG